MNKLLKKAFRFAKRTSRHIQKIVKSFDHTVVLSLGENCLADDILRRNGLKSFSSPYSAGRSNIEYVLAFEGERYSDFLNPAYLRKEPSNSNTIVVRNKKYMDLCNSYHPTVIHGFEFTHHDVLDNPHDKDALNRRCYRMLHLKKKRLVFLYHHRLCDQTDFELLIRHLNQYAEIYRSRGNEVSIFLFTQKIITTPDERRVEQHLDNGIHFYTFHTLTEWAGDDPDILWARCDNDLIRVMINHIKQAL